MILALTSLSVHAADTLTEENLNDSLAFPGYHDGQEHTVDSIQLGTPESPFETIAKGSYFLLMVDGGSKAFIQNTSLHVQITGAHGDGNDAFYAFNANGWGSSAEIHFTGPIDIVVSEAEGVTTDYGISSIYAQNGGQVIIGSKDSNDLVRIWTLASKPDTIGAKTGGDVTFLSTNNQIVGSFDLFGTNTTPEGEESRITATFSGSSAYWFGDDTSHANTKSYALSRDHNNGVLDVTVEKGAQWSYLGLGNPLVSGFLPSAHQKRISNITLRDGGIINLFDESLLGFWKSIGLLDRLQNGRYSVNHDYVEIGDLKGNGGIFQLDLDVTDKSKSDVIFIEGSTNPGQHAIDLVAHDLTLLNPINPGNTLIFAVTKGTASDDTPVTFVDKVNERGEGLVDYELQIASNTFIAGDEDREEFKGKSPSTGVSNYEGGTKWFIEPIVLSKSAASRGFTGAGYGSYDAAVEMDRHDRRLLETVRDGKDPENGL